MRRPRKTLTTAAVRAAKTPGKYFDGHGLYLLVRKAGTKQWLQRIVIRGKRREIGLGTPALVSLSEARDLAISNLKLARAGGDPIAARKRDHSVLTFSEAAKVVHELHKPTWRNEKHAADFLNSLETHAFPRLGGLKMTDITTGDVLATLTPIWTKLPETARRVRQRISLVMRWSIAKGWRQDNPAENIEEALPNADRKPTHRVALPYPDVSRCIATVRASKAWTVTKLALEFLILTTARSKEVREARWSEMDFGLFGLHSDAAVGRSVWTVPAGRMKMKREHRVPLPARAIEILREAAQFRRSSDDADEERPDWVFPSAKGTALSDMTLSKLVKELGFNADVHGFRTSFRTWTQEQTDCPREVAEAQLAHAVGDAVEAAYARSDLFDKRRHLMEDWASYIAVKPTAEQTVVRLA